MTVKKVDTSENSRIPLSKDLTLVQPISMSNGPNKKKLITSTRKNNADKNTQEVGRGRPEKIIDWKILDEACLKDLDMYAASHKCGVSHVKLMEALRETFGLRFSEYKAKVQAPLKEKLFEIWWDRGTNKNDVEALKLVERRLNKETGGDPDQSQQQININIKLHLDDFKQKITTDQYSTIELDQDEFIEITETDESGSDGETL